MKKTNELLYAMIQGLQNNGWTDRDIKDLIHRETIHPRTFSLAMLFRVDALVRGWYALHRMGSPRDLEVLDEIEALTIGGKARAKLRHVLLRDKIKIIEVVRTKQGEGPAVGRDVVLVRTAGCNLRCPWCDTKRSWTGGTVMSPGTLKNEIAEVGDGVGTLLLTGGEPLMWQYNTALIQILYLWALRGGTVHLETNGTILPRRIVRDAMGLIAVSPKFGVTGDREYWEWRVDQWEEDVAPIWKVVVGTEEDRDNAEKYLDKITPERVWVMPLGVNGDELKNSMKIVGPLVKKHGWQISERRQIVEGFV